MIPLTINTKYSTFPPTHPLSIVGFLSNVNPHFKNWGGGNGTPEFIFKGAYREGTRYLEDRT